MHVARRWTSTGLLVASAAGFALSVGGGRWWSIGDAFEIGPLGARQCTDGDCVPTAFWLDAGPRFERAATATAAAGFVTMVILLGLAGALAAGRSPRLVRRMAIAALATAAAAAALFVATFPGLAGAQLGSGAILYVAAVVGAAAAVAVMPAAAARPTPAAA